jgi:hypothetical protein
MKKDENTRNAASQAATTIHISHLDSSSLGREIAKDRLEHLNAARTFRRGLTMRRHTTSRRAATEHRRRVGDRPTTRDRPAALAPILVAGNSRGAAQQ